jgi:hypothetical protein
MAEEPGTRAIRLDLSDLHWDLPAASRHRLAALAQLAGIGPKHRGRPLPPAHRQKILGALLDHLFPDGTTAHLLKTAASLDRSQREYLTTLIAEASSELDRRQAEAPSTLLGFPPDTRAKWANLLDRGWVPMPQGAVALRKD